MKTKILLNKLILICSILLLVACKETNVQTNIHSNTENSNPTVFPVSDMVINANNYIQENMSIVDTTFKNTYHLTAPIGWINDPNGFSEFNGAYHLFYQYNPYDAVWGPMHWGHQTTKDFIKWELEDVALAPDKEYDASGCFSGTAITVDGKHYLAYTAVTDFQNQAIAYSEDGVTYQKLDDLILSGADLPAGFSNNDFRDPKIFERDGRYYMLVGNKDNTTNLKQIIMFSADIITGPYSYNGVIYSRQDVGGIFECPDLITIGGQDVLIASPQQLGSDYYYSMQNADSCVYLVGRLSVNTNKFYKADNNLELEEFDKGFSFYAPQTMTTNDGRSIMVAWMRSWSEPNLTQVDGWCGAMTLPRELTIKDNHIYQSPVREINNYLQDKVTTNDMTLSNETVVLEDFSSRTAKITLEIDPSELDANGKAGIEVYKGTKYATKIFYDKSRGCVVFDRSNCGSLMDGARYAKVDLVNGKIKLDIYLDVNSVEVFINDGYYTMTGTTYTPAGNDDIALFTTNGTAGFSNLAKWEIVV